MQAMSQSGSPRGAVVTSLPGVDRRRYVDGALDTAADPHSPDALGEVLDRLAAFELVLRRMVDRLARTEAQLLDAVEQSHESTTRRLEALRSELAASTEELAAAVASAVAAAPAPAPSPFPGFVPVASVPPAEARLVDELEHDAAVVDPAVMHDDELDGDTHDGDTHDGDIAGDSGVPAPRRRRPSSRPRPLRAR